VNNFLAGVQVAAWAEAVGWLERTEIDRSKAMAFLVDGAAGSPIGKVVTARMVSGDYAPNFLLRLMTKDLGYAVAEAGQRNITLHSAAAALAQFRAAIDAGHGDKDMAAIVEAVRIKA